MLVPPQHGGEACPSLDATKTCNDFPCPVDCKVENNMTRGQILIKKNQVGSWSSWSSCSKTCNSGQSKRRRLVETQPEHGGISCPVLKSSKTCNEFPCPIDCEVSCSKLNTAKNPPRLVLGPPGAAARSLATGDQRLDKVEEEEQLQLLRNMEERPVQLLVMLEVATTCLVQLIAR